jgi:hypothetical protein
MLGPKGVITIFGNVKRVENCLQRGSDIADAQMVAFELEEYKKTADQADPSSRWWISRVHIMQFLGDPTETLILTSKLLSGLV